MKTCTKCQKVKSIDDFHKRSDGKQGRMNKCKECRSAEAREKYDPIKTSRRYQNNKEKKIKQQREWRRNNHKKDLERQKEYRRNNVHNAWKRRYLERATKYGIAPVIEEFTRNDVLAKYGDQCHWCPTGEFEALDHVIPVRLGGPHTLANVRPSCTPCNSRRWHEELSTILMAANVC